MEGIPNFESLESRIDKRIEELASREEMNSQDIFSDIVTFAGIAQEDEDAKFYFEELAEKLGLSFEEMIGYATKKANQENSE